MRCHQSVCGDSNRSGTAVAGSRDIGVNSADCNLATLVHGDSSPAIPALFMHSAQNERVRFVFLRQINYRVTGRECHE